MEILESSSSDRIGILHRYHILHTPPEQAFDDITSLALHLCEATMASLAFGEGELWVKSASCSKAIDFTAPLDNDFACAARKSTLVIEDARKDARLVSHPSVEGEPHVRFYASTPVLTQDGDAVGVLTVLDVTSRELTTRQLECLEALARQAAALLELRRLDFAAGDQTTYRSGATLQRDPTLEAEYKGLFERAHDAIIVLNPEDGAVLDVNRRACEMYGFSREELLGKLMIELARHKGRVPERIKETLEKDEDNFESEHFRKDGSVLHVEINTSVVSFRGRRAILCINRDIGERKRMEEALRRVEDQALQTQKMEAVGRLAGGIAHEFNNLLAVIVMQADLMMMRMATDNPARTRLTEIRAAADRAAALTRQLLAFSRRQLLRPHVIDLNASLKELANVLRHALGERISLDVRGARGLGFVKADPGQIEQVVVNLAVNARDAMPGGGELVIRTRNAELVEDTDETLLQELGLSAGRYVVLSVEDTGEGMDEETRARIFEPFFSTKGPGKGTGLGLPVVYGVVVQSGGGIRVESRPGSGTTFEIYLPRVDAPEQALSIPERDEAALPKGTETILLVEDEEMVRGVTRVVLEMCGYAVIEAEDGDVALAAAREHKGPLDLLLTDVVMPRMNGTELAPRVKELFPDAKVIYMSGYIEGDDLPRVLDGGELLSKPFPPDTLARKVRAVLDARA